MNEELFYKHKNIYLIPSVHGTPEFAGIVRKVFFDVQPDCVAVELPEQMTGLVLKGVRRLPYLSAVRFQADDNNYHYIPIQPCDSIIEAVRLADEHSKSLYFTDKDIKDISVMSTRSPDSYYVNNIGLKKYVELYQKHLTDSDSNSIHYFREMYMAHRVRILSLSFNKVLFVYGLYHHRRIMEFLKKDMDFSEELSKRIKRYELDNPMMFTERQDLELNHLPKQSYNEMLGTMPFEMYLYELGRKGIGSYQMGIELPPEEHRIKNQKKIYEDFIQKAEVGAEKLKNIPTTTSKVDAYEYLHELIFQSRRLYNREWNDFASTGKLSLVLKFARNYALVNHQLVPTPYQLITSAKNIVNDDFAWEMARLINFYPFFDNIDNLDKLFINEGRASIDNKEYNLRSYLPINPWILDKIPLKRRSKEKNPGDWRKVWNLGFTLLTYPPEDIIRENYFHYLRRKAKKTLEEGFTRSIEFKGSIMDGIDIKETIRNLHLDKIYVKEQIPVRGEVGTVVMIFDDDESYEKYPFQITWYAEHNEQSDLALYSTPHDEKLIGPGISKAEYGGVLSVFPPQQVPDVWRDLRFNKAKNRKERLLYASIIYADKKYILYIAPNPPRNYFRSLAESYGHHIIYISLDSLSDFAIKKLRTFHILSGYHIRPIAGRYIRDD